MKGIGLAGILWVGIVPLAWANDVVVCDPAHPLVPNAVVDYLRAVPSDQFLGNPNALIWEAPHEAMSFDQKNAMDTLRAALDRLSGINPQYWKCQGSIPMQMSQTEKDMLDAPIVAEQARQAAFDSEVASNQVCGATLNQIDNRIDTLIDPVTNLAEAKAAMKVALKRIARCLLAVKR